VRRAAAAGLLVLLAAPAVPADVPGAVIVLETPPGTPGSDPAGAPPRFVLLKDGQVFVGGTSHVEAGRLEKGEAQALRKRAEQVRKLPGLSSPVALGGDATLSLRLRVLEGDPVEVVANGEPQAAPPALAPLAALLTDLLRFDHPSLRPYVPTSYAMTVREARVAGGCRRWDFAFPLAEALASPRAVTAAEASGWPTGAIPGFACLDDPGPSTSPGRRYVVTLRPLLPGERP
jgi:hypothetical protein